MSNGTSSKHELKHNKHQKFSMTHWGTVLHRVQRASQVEPGQVRTGTGRACSRGDMIELARQKSGEGITSHCSREKQAGQKKMGRNKGR
jgi:hypothetical protein